MRQALTDDMAKTLATSLIHTRINYANSLIHGPTNIKKYSVHKPQLLA